jgi:hypothetical protein
VAEALRARATDQDWAADRREHADRSAERPDRERDRQSEQRDHDPEDFGDSWRAYQERAERLRQTYGWTVPQPPPRVEPWLALGRDDD